MPDFYHYYWFTFDCISAGPFCTPRLREELSQLSLQALYGRFEINMFTWEFWTLTSTIIEMLHNKVSHGYLHCGATFTNKCQNLLEQFPHLITDLPTVCFEGFRKANPDKALILLVYEAHFSHIPQFTTLNPALAFDLLYIGHQIRGIIKMIVTLHPQRYKLKFTGQHYAVVACHSINVILKQYPNSLWQDFDLRFFYFLY